jgi:cardiolipin synthase
MGKKKAKKRINGYNPNNYAELVRGGKEYFDRLQKLIEMAKDTIHLQVYIFDDDETGTRIAKALKAAAKRNVKVYLMVDGYASKVMSKEFTGDLQNAGIHFRFFDPLFRSKSFYFGRRLHQKVFVADSRYALVSGMNITNRYNDRPGYPAWLDFGVFVEGETAKELCMVCWQTWKGFQARMKSNPCEENLVKFEIAPDKSSLVRIRRNDWVRRKTQISRSYNEILRNAKSHVTLLSSYFLPGDVIKRNLIRAVKKGVKIKVILAGLSDVKVAKYAERYIYDWLLKNNIEIYEYQGNVLHGKMSVCDSEWITIGSYNINNISAYASIELNLDIRNPSFATNAEEILNELINEKCVRITETSFKKSSNIFNRCMRWLSYQFIRIAFYIFTFYFRQKN